MSIFGKRPKVEIDIEEVNVFIGQEAALKIRPTLAFYHRNINTNFNYMAQVTNLTLTSLAAVILNMTVVDANNNNAVIAGTLSNLSYVPGDATQDVAVVDSNNPLSVDVRAVSQQGGTNIVATGSFISTALQADGVTPVFSGTVTGTLVVVNNIVVAVLNPVLAFNQ